MGLWMNGRSDGPRMLRVFDCNGDSVRVFFCKKRMNKQWTTNGCMRSYLVSTCHQKQNKILFCVALQTGTHARVQGQGQEKEAAFFFFITFLSPPLPPPPPSSTMSESTRMRGDPPSIARTGGAHRTHPHSVRLSFMERDSITPFVAYSRQSLPALEIYHQA